MRLLDGQPFQQVLPEGCEAVTAPAGPVALQLLAGDPVEGRGIRPRALAWAGHPGLVTQGTAGTLLWLGSTINGGISPWLMLGIHHQWLGFLRAIDLHQCPKMLSAQVHFQSAWGSVQSLVANLPGANRKNTPRITAD